MYYDVYASVVTALLVLALIAILLMYRAMREEVNVLETQCECEAKRRKSAQINECGLQLAIFRRIREHIILSLRLIEAEKHIKKQNAEIAHANAKIAVFTATIERELARRTEPDPIPLDVLVSVYGAIE